MGRYEKVCELAKEMGVPVRTILVKHLENHSERLKIATRINQIDEDEDMKPDDLYQLCDTPPSQKRLIRFF
jgi:hypothetical protein